MIVFNRRFAIISHDLIMVGLAFLLALLSRHNFSILSAWDGIGPMLLLVATIQGLILWWTRLYRGVWRFASIPDLWNIIRAAAIGALAVSLALFLFNRLEGVPRASLVLYPIYLIFLLGAPRLIYRVWQDHGLNLSRVTGCDRVLILGAGRAGEMLAREMRRDAECDVVGFLDDDKKLHGAKVHGIPVLAAIDQLSKVRENLGIDIIVIALPSATNAQMQRVVELCEKTGIPFRTLPKLQDLVSGGPVVKALREVAIEDLLGREPVTLDWNRISRGLAGKIVLVSGGGGSIGSELCRQIAKLAPQALIVLEQSEYALYAIEAELRGRYRGMTLHARLGDICDPATVERIFREFGPSMVFHAAAYKHVPMLEEQAREAVRNNILGTRVLALAADKFGCSTFVMVSTDKAVNPANVMGATKRVAEIFCQTLSRRSETRFITVRFGNVLGSTGSVVPLFQKQIEAGGPVTVTHPEVTRYFMTIAEASQLILQASVMGKGGEIFVLNMGESVKIRYLAEQMIRLSGKVPGEDIAIVYTGLRPGEKLYEELFYAQESFSATSHEKILLAHSRETDWKLLNEALAKVEKACRVFNEEAVRTLLKEMVPEMGQTGMREADNVIPLQRPQGMVQA
ncbi:MAG: polysaccharide biosynthesis protein CapD [Gammaproteobacteria bacterium]|nr:MAG: polysaccharide biosynthesis protein CapD [Gammaproteobacteria bacterium]TND07018.1 MAG: polysaccharide biosynthesis protein CapD [Gammaproteobacteria bacterium]